MEGIGYLTYLDTKTHQSNTRNALSALSYLYSPQSNMLLRSCSSLLEKYMYEITNYLLKKIWITNYGRNILITRISTSLYRLLCTFEEWNPIMCSYNTTMGKNGSGKSHTVGIQMGLLWHFKFPSVGNGHKPTLGFLLFPIDIPSLSTVFSIWDFVHIPCVRCVLRIGVSFIWVHVIWIAIFPRKLPPRKWSMFMFTFKTTKNVCSSPLHSLERHVAPVPGTIINRTFGAMSTTCSIHRSSLEHQLHWFLYDPPKLLRSGVSYGNWEQLTRESLVWG